MSPSAADAIEAFTSSQGAISLAVTVLAAVLGVRLLAPRGASVPAALAYVAALAVTWLGHAGLVGPGPGPESPTTVRLAGAALLVFGLIGGGRAARARAEAGGRDVGAERKVLGSLALVLAGQLLRAPSVAGLTAGAVAALVIGWAAWKAGRA